MVELSATEGRVIRNLSKAHDLSIRVVLCALDVTIILYMMLILLMTINLSLHALTNITDRIGAAYSAAPVPHNILIPDWAWGFTLLFVWNGAVIVRGVILLDKLSLYMQTYKHKKLR